MYRRCVCFVWPRNGAISKSTRSICQRRHQKCTRRRRCAMNTGSRLLAAHSKRRANHKFTRPRTRAQLDDERCSSSNGIMNLRRKQSALFIHCLIIMHRTRRASRREGETHPPLGPILVAGVRRRRQRRTTVSAVESFMNFP